MFIPPLNQSIQNLVVEQQLLERRLDEADVQRRKNAPIVPCIGANFASVFGQRPQNTMPWTPLLVTYIASISSARSKGHCINGPW